MASFAERVSGAVLRSCRLHDSDARIASVLRDSDGRTIVRLKAGSSSAAQLLESMKQLWPLADTAVVESAFDNTLQAQIVVPSEEDEWKQAQRRASASSCARRLHTAAFVLLSLGALAWAVEVVD